MIEFLKQLILARVNRPKPSVEEVEVQVWAFVVKSITIMVLGIAFGTLWLIGFEKQETELAPIDAIFLEILKAIAFMGVGTMGGISGRKASNAIAKAIVGEDDATK
jgi:hypothetical protein